MTATHTSSKISWLKRWSGNKWTDRRTLTFTKRGVNRHFQAKLAWYWNSHIFKTTTPNPPNLHSDKDHKCPSLVFPTHASQIQGGGRSPSWKNRKIAIFWPRFERFWRNLAQWHSSTLWRVRLLKEKFKNPRWRRAPSWKVEKSHLGRGMYDFYKIWHSEAVRRSGTFRPLKI